MKARIGLALCCWALAACFAPPAFCADTPVMRVVVLESVEVTAYLREMERGKALIAANGIEVEIRVWRAKFAGPEAGRVVVHAVYPSLAALAANDAKMTTVPELQAWTKGLDKVRTIVSDSLYSELKP